MEKRMDLLLYFWPQKWQKMAEFSSKNLQILNVFSIFRGGGGGLFSTIYRQK